MRINSGSTVVIDASPSVRVLLFGLVGVGTLLMVMSSSRRTGAVFGRRRLRSLTAGGDEKPCRFSDFFEANTEGPGIHKWRHYFAAYEREFGRHCGPAAEPVRMMEIGIQSGGSMRMWRDRFGDALELLVGVDINPNTKAWEEFGPNIAVEIGSQADAATFEQVDAEHPGGFDIILDDGSHVAEHMIKSFELTFQNLLRPGGVYLIEDITQENVAAVHTILHELNYKGVPSLLPDLYHHTGRGPCCEFNTNPVQADVEYIVQYPMILAIRKRKAPVTKFEAPRHGTQWIPYHA